jgi:hypothetical protein
MPRGHVAVQERSKGELIAEVLGGNLDMPTANVRAAVWRRFGAEVTAREIAQVKQRLRKAEAGEESRTPGPPAESPGRERKAEAVDVTKEKPEPAKKAAADGSPQKKAPPPRIRAKDFAGAEVTVKQLSAILEVAEAAGGLRKLQEALRVVMQLRDKVGDVDERQLAFALDFLARLTGRK